MLRAALDRALYAALNAAMMAGALPTLLALSARKRRACVALLVLLFGLLLTLGMLVCQRHIQSVAMQPLPFVWLSRRLRPGGYLLVALCQVCRGALHALRHALRDGPTSFRAG